MAVDTPATIAVIGAGPIGLEAALYARFLGYDVHIYERGRVAERLLTASDAPPTPWHLATSKLGAAALAAQHTDWQPPASTAPLSATALAATYFEPLVGTDLLTDSLERGVEVLSIERDVSPEDEPIAEDEVAGFRLTVQAGGGQRVDRADVVIDVSGAGTAGFGPTEADLDYYVLGAKSAGVGSDFTFATGLAQIRDLFAIIADRPTLDLYATVNLPGA